MSTITPMLDTLLPQVLGRRADMERFTGMRTQLLPIGAVAPAAAPRPDVFDRPLPGGRPQGLVSDDTSPSDAAPRRGAEAQSTRGATMQARYAAAMPRAETSARPQLSREGALIAALLSRAGGARSATVPMSAPVLLCPNGVPAPAALAALLGQQVMFSGVFYESHLWKWFEGSRAQSQLAHEPQNQPPPRQQGGATTATPAAAATAHHGPTALPLLSIASKSGVMRHDALPGGAEHALEADGEAELVDDHLLPIVRQQLEALSSSVFRWHGAAWPGAGMQWEIHEQEQEASTGTPDDEPDAPPFSTRIRIDLPRLGMLELVLNLDGEHADVYAFAATKRGAQAVQSSTSVLEQRFQKAGFLNAHVELIEAERQ
ncbi:hypothetical protein SADO_05340 [Salinisphaera dokdonensis CL-ES53]|uniref:Flagellar hook-length control protein-like C-terminal domain-containing protein n=1 Tax=Salinisphaera dokdonensis CL-ES53 TaxID=1304272 RepID=A0ABV2AYE1_9GAMM